MPAPSADAIARLKHMTWAGKEPTLADADITEILGLYQRTDAAGLAPTDPAWVETYDYNRAAAEGWRRKAGKAVGLNAVRSGDEQRFDATHLQCMAMVRAYERGTGRIGAIEIGTPYTPEVL